VADFVEKKALSSALGIGPGRAAYDWDNTTPTFGQRYFHFEVLDVDYATAAAGFHTGDFAVEEKTNEVEVGEKTIDLYLRHAKVENNWQYAGFEFDDNNPYTLPGHFPGTSMSERSLQNLIPGDVLLALWDTDTFASRFSYSFG
jgi:hypothetical protein